jgi:hypothetical protein
VDSELDWIGIGENNVRRNKKQKGGNGRREKVKKK